MEYTLITGPTSGIGLEFARLFARDKNNLLLVGRNKEKLKSLADKLHDAYGISVAIITQDLAVPGAANKIVAAVKKQKLVVTVLVNNAGFGAQESFTRIPLQKQTDMIAVNTTVPTELMHYFIQEMVKRGRGRVLNVSSAAAFMPGPYMATYYATKWYIYALSRAVAKELEGSGVTVTTLCPGATKTHFGEEAQVRNKDTFDKGMSAEEVAKQGYNGMLKGKQLVVPGAVNKFYAFLSRVLPTKTALTIVANIQK